MLSRGSQGRECNPLIHWCDFNGGSFTQRVCQPQRRGQEGEAAPSGDGAGPSVWPGSAETPSAEGLGVSGSKGIGTSSWRLLEAGSPFSPNSSPHGSLQVLPRTCRAGRWVRAQVKYAQTPLG